MRIRLSYFLPLIFALFLPNLSFAAITTGPIKPEVILPFHPELNAVGTAYRVPVVVSGVTGVAEIGADLTVGRLLSVGARGLLGPWGMAAITAAQLCYEQTDWKICHSTIEPIIPLQIDTSKITAATASTPPTVFYEMSSYLKRSLDISTLCSQMGWLLGTYSGSTKACYSSSAGGLTGSSYLQTTILSRSCNSTISICTVPTTYSCSTGTLTNSTGAPMAVTGQFCTPASAYSCPTNYARSDSYGNLGDGMFCSYQSPVLTDAQQKNILAPYLLNYYANQLFAKPDGSPNTDFFSDPDTTFDPAAVPSDMPMTWDQLKQYVDWVRNGIAQTTDPLAPHYVSPKNYDYTKTYINNNNSTSTVTNNTSSATSTITPEQATSSAAMTQTQYEESNKKADTEQATALNTAMNPLTNVLTQYNADKQFMIDKITSPTEPPAAMPDIFTWAWPTGQCQGFTLKFRVHVPLIGMLSMDKLVNEHCPPYNEWAHPALFWFFNIITGLYLFRLWDKTAAEVVRI